MKSLHNFMVIMKYRSSPSEVLLGKGALKIYIKFTENTHAEVRSVISIKLLQNFIEITLRHGCSPVNQLHIFRIPFYRKTYGGLFLQAPNENVQELFILLSQFVAIPSKHFMSQFLREHNLKVCAVTSITNTHKKPKYQMSFRIFY